MGKYIEYPKYSILYDIESINQFLFKIQLFNYICENMNLYMFRS